MFKNTTLIIITIICINYTLPAQVENKMERTDNNENLFIYHLKLTPTYDNPEKWTDETYNVIKVHAEFLDSLGREGILVFAGRTTFNPGDKNLFGIAVIKAPSLEMAKKIMANDPAVLNNIQMASIFPFSIGIRHFENLK